MTRIYVNRGIMLWAATLVVCCGMVLPQCESGGLRANDFVRISQSGFDAADTEEDRNEYAWSMKFFKPDGADDGHVYVGTGNNISGIFAYYSNARLTGGDTDDPPVRAPEIRRYRPDLGENVWEKVFDYHDVSDDELSTYGFRFMLTYDAVDEDQKGARATYLYASSQGNGSTLWRSKSGDAGSWESVFTTGLNHASMRALAAHDGKLYAGFAFDTVGQEVQPPGEIWVSDDGISFEPLMQDGFGNPYNRGVEFLISYNGWLWAGTKNDAEGYEVWKLEGPGGAGGPVKVVDHGGPDPRNEAAGTPAIFKGKLYVGSLLFYGYNRVQDYGFKGCDIIRIDSDDSWETVVGNNSISGYDSGFNYFTNAYCWQMKEHDGWLYAGTWDQANLLAGLLDNLPELIEFLQEQQKAIAGEVLDIDDWYRLTEAGGDIFKTQDGTHWFPLTQDGLGNRENYGFRTMESTPDGDFYLGTANPASGLEVWRAVPAAED